MYQNIRYLKTYQGHYAFNEFNNSKKGLAKEINTLAQYLTVIVVW